MLTTNKNFYTDFEKQIENDNNYVINYYAPTNSEEYFNLKENRFYNRQGVPLRNLSNYNALSEGYTPFGDE